MLIGGYRCVEGHCGLFYPTLGAVRIFDEKLREEITADLKVGVYVAFDDRFGLSLIEDEEHQRRTRANRPDLKGFFSVQPL